MTDQDLENLFSEIPGLVSATIIMDRVRNRSKGFGFVEFESADSVKQAIDKFNGHEEDGRALVVNEARPKTDRPRNDNNRGGW